MTETELGLCDVCARQPAIGVASTSIPYSCAFCKECAQRGADPEMVFEHLLWDVANGDPTLLRPELLTFNKTRGRYEDMPTWAEGRERLAEPEIEQ